MTEVVTLGVVMTSSSSSEEVAEPLLGTETSSRGEADVFRFEFEMSRKDLWAHVFGAGCLLAVGFMIGLLTGKCVWDRRVVFKNDVYYEAEA